MKDLTTRKRKEQMARLKCRRLVYLGGMYNCYLKEMNAEADGPKEPILDNETSHIKS